MRIYQYKGRSSEGDYCRGKIRATNQFHAVKLLRSDGITPTLIVEANFVTTVIYVIRNFITRFITVKKLTLINFAEEISNLLKAGLPINIALIQMSKSVKSYFLRLVLQQIVQKIEDGNDLSVAFSGYPFIFPKLFISFMDQSNVVDSMAAIFANYAESIKEQQKIKTKILEAMRPVIFGIPIMVIVFYIMNEYVLNKFQRMFIDQNKEMPYETQLLIDFISFFANNMIYYIFFFMACLAIFYSFLRIPYLKKLWHRLKLNILLYGNIHKLLIRINFVKVVKISIKVGYPIQDCLDLASHTISNKYLAARFAIAVNCIRSGESVVTAIAATNLFTNSDVEMLRIAEKTEDYSNVFKNIESLNLFKLEKKVSLLKEIVQNSFLIMYTSLVIFLAVGFYSGYYGLLKNIT